MTATVDEITVRRAESVADYLACQSVQRRAWGISDESYVVPVATMVGAQHHGGLVLGAFLPSGEAVGMSFAFLGRVDGGRLCLYSQLTGVAPGYQDRGLGVRIKTAQREVARSENVPCVAWAFDPLQAGNARFNLSKLGASAVRYVENMYGPRSDALNQNTPTDRLIAVWETIPEPARAWEKATIAEAPRLIDVQAASDGVPLPTAAAYSSSPVVLLEIPAEIQSLRAERPEAAIAWGHAVRNAFREAFARGYRAVGFVREETIQERRCAYVLERAEIRPV